MRHETVIPALSDGELLATLVRGTAEQSSLLAWWLSVLVEFDRREVWLGEGFHSCRHWLQHRCGASSRTAREYVQVAHALAGAPLTQAAFAEGRLSYSKVRALARVLRADNEDFFLGLAFDLSAFQLDHHIHRWEAAQVERPVDDEALAAKCGVTTWVDIGGLVHHEVVSPSEEGAVINRAIEYGRDQLYKERRAADKATREAGGEVPVRLPRTPAQRNFEGLSWVCKRGLVNAERDPSHGTGHRRLRRLVLAADADHRHGAAERQLLPRRAHLYRLLDTLTEHRPRAIVLVAILLSTAVALGATAVGAQENPTPPAPGSGVEITPAIFQADLGERSFSTSVLIVNHESAPRRISLSVTGLGHDLEGGPEFIAPSPTSIELTDGELVLGPGERKDVGVQGQVPKPGPGLYAGIVAEYAPLDAQKGGSIEIRTRVATLVLVRAPRPWKETLEVVGAGVQPGPPGQPATVYGVVRNTGDVHVKPSGTARLVKDGQVLATVALSAANVLPGYARRLTGSWTPPTGLTGDVTVEIETAAPAAKGSGTTSFTNAIPAAPAARIDDLRAAGGAAPEVTLTLTNTGTTELSPSVTLTATEAGTERARTVLPVAKLAPGAAAPLSWKPKLDDGLYVIRAEARDGQTVLAEATTGLRIGGGGAEGDAGSGSRRPVPWVLALLALGLLVLAAAWIAVVAWRRRGERDR